MHYCKDENLVMVNTIDNAIRGKKLGLAILQFRKLLSIITSLHLPTSNRFWTTIKGTYLSYLSATDLVPGIGN